MIKYSDALKKVTNEATAIKPRTELVSLENSLGRILADDIFTSSSLPAFSNSAMDGIAIKHAETHTQWAIVGEISAGNFNEVSLQSGQAVQIMTGAKIPGNCDTVIPKEDYVLNKAINNETRAVLKPDTIVKTGQFVRLAGEDLKNGTLILQRSTVISPRQIPILATFGYSQIPVYKKLKVALFATGDELVEINTTPIKDQIRCSNLPSIVSLIQAAGHEAISHGIVRDNPQEIRKALQSILESDIDVLLTTGGASVGELDFINRELATVGVKTHFSGSAIKPGMPCTFGTDTRESRKILVFALPGNPVSCFVNFQVYVLPAMQKIFELVPRARKRAMLNVPIKKRDQKRHFVRGILQQEEADGSLKVVPLKSQSSGNLWELAQANCLIVVEEQTTELNKGDFVECIAI